MTRFREHIRRKICGAGPRFCVVIGAAVCLGGMLGALDNILRFVTVTTSDGSSASLYAPATSAHYLLSLTGLTGAQQDVLTLTDAGDRFATLAVERAFPLDVTADGKTTQQMTVPCTVAQALASMGISVGKNDFSEPSLTSAVTQSTGSVTLHRVEYREYEKDTVIPYEKLTHYTSLFYQTKDRVLEIQPGVDGYFRGTMRDKLIDGEVVETVALQTIESREMVPEILKKYKAGAPVSDVEAPVGITVENGVPSSFTTKYEMRATGYYSPRGKGSSGLGLYYGTFAVDPTLIPYGTKVYIASQNGKFVYGWAIATDTGAFIHTTRLQVDLFYETYTESAANGVQQVYVYVP